MNLENLTPNQRDIRAMIRGFLILATPQQLQREKEIAEEQKDTFRADCIQELIDEDNK